MWRIHLSYKSVADNFSWLKPKFVLRVTVGVSNNYDSFAFEYVTLSYRCSDTIRCGYFETGGLNVYDEVVERIGSLDRGSIPTDWLGSICVRVPYDCDVGKPYRRVLGGTYFDIRSEETCSFAKVPDGLLEFNLLCPLRPR
jgi:hypothetical protein